MPIVDTILEVLTTLGELAPRPFETKYAWGRRLRNIGRPQFERGMWHLRDRGLIKIVKRDSQQFIQLTKAGQLEVLLLKAKKIQKQKWDGKWRLIMFDIPEDAKPQREIFRTLLKANGFYKLQASVYISPYPLNRSAISYLTETKLINYIRILRVDQIDSDAALKKYFYLK